MSIGERKTDSIAKKRYDQVIIGAGVQDKIAYVLDEVMDHEANDVLPNMQDHVFDDEYDDDEADENESEIHNELLIISAKPCLLDLTKLGWQELEKVNVREVHQHATKWFVQKRDTIKYIMRQVIKMKCSTRAVSVCDENTRAECSVWSSYLNEIRPNYY